MYLLRIACRNLLRRRGRTLAIASILALAVVFFLFMESLMTGLMDITFGNVIDFETPHIEVGRPEFFAAADGRQVLPLDQTFKPDDDLLASVRASEGFVALTPVLDFSAVFTAGSYEFPVRVRAIEPGSFEEVFRNQEYVVAGSFIEAGEPGVVVGAELASVFDLEVGDRFSLRFHDRAGAPATRPGQITGIVSVPHPDMNLGTVFMTRDQATAWLGLERGQVSRVMVRMDSRQTAATEAGRLQQDLPGVQVRSYRDASELLVSLEAWGRLEMYFILALFLLVGAIGIVSVIVLAAIERVKEIGVMKALGLTEGEIVRVFLIEAGGIGAVGGLVGSVLGAAVMFWLTVYGVSMEAFLDLGAMGVPLADRMYGAWNTASFVLISAFVIAVAVIASIAPAYWAARKDPVDAIRHI